MRIANYYNNRDVRLEELPLPAIRCGEILMKVESAGICGTDLLEWYRVKKAPLVLGHEVAGTIEKAGDGLAGYKVGDRIAASHHVPCGSCHYCARGHETVCDMLRATHFEPGGFAEYLRIPAINIEKGGVYSLPDDLSFEEATFIEPLACVLRGQRAAQLKSKDTVLVLGSGISGLLHIQLARENSTGLIFATDVSEFRLNGAKKFGADYAIDAREDVAARIKQLNDGRLADLVILCTGAKSAIMQALNAVERGGTVLIFAAADEGVNMPLSINDLFWRNEITLTSSYAAASKEHIEALELICKKKIRVKEMITHRLGLADCGQGFKLAASPNDVLKVIIEPQR